MLREVKNVNVCIKILTPFCLKVPIYTKVLSNEELQSKQVNMVEKLKMSTEVVQNIRPNEVYNSWEFQVEKLYKNVV